MKRLLISLVALIALLVGCNQSVSQGQGNSPEDIAKVTYEWEKATLEADYEQEQNLLFKEGTYEIHKDTPVRQNNLKFEDMEIEVYYDEENDWYYSLINYINPERGNKVEDSYVVRKNNEELKIDIDKSKEIDESEIRDSFTQEACINCS